MACTVLERYEASMVLSGVGDALGYRNGLWEFCDSGVTIHKELKKLGGLENIDVKLPEWRVSDDTVMHLATAQALASMSDSGTEKEAVYLELAAQYKECMNDMGGRAPGVTCMNYCCELNPHLPGGYQIAFNRRGGGCGAAMRAMCIGLRFPRPEDLDDLIAVGVEAGRMTHHHPSGYLGSVTAALFTAYSIQGKPLREWGHSLVNDVLPRALAYVESQGRYVQENRDAWSYFEQRWREYLEIRKISDGQSDPVFTKENDISYRDTLYTSFSFDGWGGASGHDSPMIAYDALLGAGNDWGELCSRGMFHSGDSDSTGVIAAACYGAMNGFLGVPSCNYEHVEYGDRLRSLGQRLYYLSHPEEKPTNPLKPVVPLTRTLTPDGATPQQ